MALPLCVGLGASVGPASHQLFSADSASQRLDVSVARISLLKCTHIIITNPAASYAPVDVAVGVSLAAVTPRANPGVVNVARIVAIVAVRFSRHLDSCACLPR